MSELCPENLVVALQRGNSPRVRPGVPASTARATPTRRAFSLLLPIERDDGSPDLLPFHPVASLSPDALFVCLQCNDAVPALNKADEGHPARCILV